jgi:dipeptide/tripeptide permease
MDNEEKQKNDELAKKLISEQNFPAAVIGGALATVLAAAAYGMTVTTWPFSYGFAAAGVGIIIGLTMGFLGRGIATKFSVAATLYTALGCLLGNLFRAMIELAPPTATSLLDVATHSSFSALWERSTFNMFSIALLYWFVAIIAAVFLARRPLSRSQRLALGLLEMRR